MYVKNYSVQSSAHLSFLSTFLQPSIHLSVHSSLHPSVHIAFVPHVDPSVMACAMPVLLYIDISVQPATFFKLPKIHNFGVVGTEKLLTDFSWETIISSITMTKNKLKAMYAPRLAIHVIPLITFTVFIGTVSLVLSGLDGGFRATLCLSDCVWYYFTCITRRPRISCGGKEKQDHAGELRNCDFLVQRAHSHPCHLCFFFPHFAASSVFFFSLNF